MWLGQVQSARQWFAEGALGKTLSCSLVRRHEAARRDSWTNQAGSLEEAIRTALETVRETFESTTDEDTADPLGEALTDVLEGLLMDDAAPVQRGIDALSDFHRQRVPDELYASEDVLDHYTSAYLVLARHRGLDVTVENEYVPAEVYEIDWTPVELPEDTPSALRDCTRVLSQ
ncbi:Imm49 family immunity protein [Haloferax denitrificans]|uniref:Uncharacterized protein n=1 Tax=Haloferax denitrificans ATCC 35960 TaxID=662478 RepID=M0JHC8_9EURY|nr:Imm49 family immunity protein [Haloferax denitrificans]EMA07419.1 hypothetical protein C438_03497 [Haloferax denitrificans ATCC 35960]